ncbi:hypothetical protein [Streptococcus agalactiae]|uniref:hypothetical protein n=1 Tax=Streptococcus agalactiae TaxID=1311 RepID=UPI001F01DA11|nr:hypothetical protein [Streptococcus agalactiae]
MTKTIVITEASSGIGEATAKFFAKKRMASSRNNVKTRKGNRSISISKYQSF